MNTTDSKRGGEKLFLPIAIILAAFVPEAGDRLGGRALQQEKGSDCLFPAMKQYCGAGRRGGNGDAGKYLFQYFVEAEHMI